MWAEVRNSLSVSTASIQADMSDAVLVERWQDLDRLFTRPDEVGSGFNSTTAVSFQLAVRVLLERKAATASTVLLSLQRPSVSASNQTASAVWAFKVKNQVRAAALTMPADGKINLANKKNSVSRRRRHQWRTSSIW